MKLLTVYVELSTVSVTFTSCLRNTIHDNTNTMKLLIASAALIYSFSSFGGEVDRITNKEYVDQWKKIAVSQMIAYKIPASITIAQAILESGSGNSLLALKANNHFGIKCHGWKGRKMYKDDDAKNECFRAYKTAEESFKDHSLFLEKNSRYDFLFMYDESDYKSWAKGLKKAGYATNPKYPRLLIDIIEKYNLQELDQLNEPLVFPNDAIAVNDNKNNVTRRTLLVHQKGVKYVEVRKGDTFYSIAQEFGLTLMQLNRYNDFGNYKDFLNVGDYVYVQPKRRRNIFKKEEIEIEKSISMNELAQIYAINVKSIKRLNNITDDEVTFSKGEKVILQ